MLPEGCGVLFMVLSWMTCVPPEEWRAISYSAAAVWMAADNNARIIMEEMRYIRFPLLPE